MAFCILPCFCFKVGFHTIFPSHHRIFCSVSQAVCSQTGISHPPNCLGLQIRAAKHSCTAVLKPIVEADLRPQYELCCSYCFVCLIQYNKMLLGFISYYYIRVSSLSFFDGHVTRWSCLSLTVQLLSNRTGYMFFSLVMNQSSVLLGHIKSWAFKSNNQN